MKRLNRCLVLGVILTGLQACSWNADSTDPTNNNHNYNDPNLWQSNPNSSSDAYPWTISALQSDPNGPSYRRIYRQITVPQSYHVPEHASPISHESRDHEWIQQQSSGRYTIMIGEGKSPAEVAKLLFESPKSQRAAQYKYQRGDGNASAGVWGSYNSPEEAEQALEKLPENIRQSAKVKNWGYVHSQSQIESQPQQGSSSTSPRPVPLIIDAPEEKHESDTGADY